MRPVLLPIALCLLSLAPPCPGEDAKRDTVRVFILAGQSNMEGKVKRELLDLQAEAPETLDLFAHLRKDGEWIQREDVFIKFLGKKGPLSVGYGSGTSSGVELEFGNILGDHFDDPVLLIKTAWGGHSLVKDFRPPSAGIPEERIQREIEKAEKRAADPKRPGKAPDEETIRAGYGASYRKMMEEIRGTLGDMDHLFPELKGRHPEISGFLWFQGWNDMYDGAEKEYRGNLIHLIRDVRKDLGKPDLPFVIGVMGQNMSQPAKGAMLAVQQAQLTTEKEPGFENNVKAVPTDILVDKAAEALFPEWKERMDEWRKTGSDRPYHYLGSAIWHLRMGRAFGQTMITLLEQPKG